MRLRLVILIVAGGLGTLHPSAGHAQQRNIVPGQAPQVEVAVPPPAAGEPDAPPDLRPAPLVPDLQGSQAVTVDPDPAIPPDRFVVEAELSLAGRPLATQAYVCDLAARSECMVRARLGDTAGAGYNGVLRLEQWPHAATYDVTVSVGAQEALKVRQGTRDASTWNAWTRTGLALAEIDHVAWQVTAGGQSGDLIFKFVPAPPVVNVRERSAPEESPPGDGLDAGPASVPVPELEGEALPAISLDVSPDVSTKEE